MADEPFEAARREYLSRNPHALAWRCDGCRDSFKGSPAAIVPAAAGVQRYCAVCAGRIRGPERIGLGPLGLHTPLATEWPAASTFTCDICNEPCTVMELEAGAVVARYVCGGNHATPVLALAKAGGGFDFTTAPF